MIILVIVLFFIFYIIIRSRIERSILNYARIVDKTLWEKDEKIADLWNHIIELDVRLRDIEDSKK